MPANLSINYCAIIQTKKIKIFTSKIKQNKI